MLAESREEEERCKQRGASREVQAERCKQRGAREVQAEK
jgi:hypothetical protein